MPLGMGLGTLLGQTLDGGHFMAFCRCESGKPYMALKLRSSHWGHSHARLCGNNKQYYIIFRGGPLCDPTASNVDFQ
jgi:hypothetical protein